MKNIGQAIIVVSAMIIFGNLMGLMSFTLLGFNSIGNSTSQDFSLINWIFQHYFALCLSMVIIGTCLLIGAINLKKYKLWANRLISIVSGLVIVIIWTLMIAFVIILNKDVATKSFSLIPVINALIFSAPFGLLIWYLNKKTTLELFKSQD